MSIHEHFGGEGSQKVLHSMRKHDLCGFLAIFDGIETGASG